MKPVFFMCCLWLATALTTASGQSHYGPALRKILDARSATGWLYFQAGTDINPLDFFDRYAEDLQLGAGDEMRLAKKETDDIGYTHFFFQQYHAGVRVRGGEFFLHTNAQRKLFSANGLIVEGLSLSIRPGLTETQAITAAQHKMGAAKYRWESEFWEKDLQAHRGKSNATYYPQPELMIFAADQNNPAPRLTYRVDLYSAAPMDERQYFVDAATGAVVAEFPLASDCGPATVNTLFNGNQNISTDKYTTGPDDYRVRDDCQATEINVRDWNSSTLTSSPVDVTSSDNTWNNTDNQRFAGSVLWATKQAYNYYQSVFSRDSYDDSDGDVDGFINAQFKDSNGNPYADNASMSFSGGTLKVGLGSAGTLAKCWGPLDVLGHEFTHAVTGSEAGLVYSGESGALNESFSDIFGEMVENFVNGSCDYLMGADRGSAIRSMSDPASKGQPATYLDSNWSAIGSTCDGTNDNCGVHTNSGVQNLWFFLLAEGGTGTNANGDNYAVTGIGKTDASRIAYKSLVDILTSGADYAAARSGAIMAANMIFGDCSVQTQQVINAWNAVGVYNTTGFDCGCSTDVVRSGVETPNVYESSNWIRSTAVVNSGKIVKYDADQYIALQPGFWAQSGSDVHAIIDGCFGAAAKPVASADQHPATDRQDPTTTVASILEKKSFGLFPNPANEAVTVAWTLPAETQASLQLLNLQGKTVRQWTVTGSGTSATLQVALNDLSPGLYFCILTDGHTRLAEKLVINR